MDNEKNTNSHNRNGLFAVIHKLMDSEGRKDKDKDKDEDEDDKQAGTTDDILAKLESGENPIHSKPKYPRSLYDAPMAPPPGLDDAPAAPPPKHGRLKY